MPTSIDSLRQQRDSVLRQMQAIDHLRRGSLSKQFFKAAPGQPTQRGPYFVLQGFFHGKKFSERVPAEQVPQVQEQVDNYRRFQTLAEEFVTLSDQITRLEPDSESKKNSNPKNSTTSASRKPKRS